MLNLFKASIFISLIILISLISIAVWVWSLIDCIKSDKKPIEKIIWILIILLLNIIGSIIYFLLRNSSDVPKKKNNEDKEPKRLKRSSKDKVLAGVCGGLGNYFNIDPTIIRLIWVLLSIFSMGTGIFLYIISAIIIPSDKINNLEKKTNEKKSSSIWIILIISITLILITLILGGIIVSLAAFNKYESQGYSTKTIRSEIREPLFENSFLNAEKIIKESIMKKEGFINKDEKEIICSKIEIIDSEKCERTRDPYGIIISSNDCYKVICKYKLNDNHDYIAEGIVSGEKIISITFTILDKSNLE